MLGISTTHQAMGCRGLVHFLHLRNPYDMKCKDYWKCSCHGAFIVLVICSEDGAAHFRSAVASPSQVCGSAMTDMHSACFSRWEAGSTNRHG